jgi:hypothetical protein
MNAEQCRSKARHLLICARQMTSPANRAVLIDLAATWMRLADLTKAAPLNHRLHEQPASPAASNPKSLNGHPSWSNIVLLAWGCAVPLRGLVRTGAFEPEQVAMLGEVVEDVLQSLGLVDRADPISELVAKTVMELAQTGERDRVRLKQLTLKAFEGRGAG